MDWIEYGKDYPTQGQACLVWNGKTRGIAYYDHGFDADIVGGLISQLTGEDAMPVTHWMPLPEPPIKD